MSGNISDSSLNMTRRGSSRCRCTRSTCMMK